MAEYKNSKINGSIISKMSAFHQQQIIKNRNYLLHLIDIALYLGKQGIAFRGHDESSDSNNQGFLFIRVIGNIFLNIFLLIIFR